MIRIDNSRTKHIPDGSGEALQMAEIYGTSSDAKPTEGFCNGTAFCEVDTGNVYLWNEDAQEWVLTLSLQG